MHIFAVGGSASGDKSRVSGRLYTFRHG